MKYSVIILLAVFALSSADAQTGASAPGGRITIECASDSAFAVIDGMFRGTTPLVLDSLAPGIHLLRLFQSRPSNWFAAVLTDSLRVTPGESRTFRYAFPSTLPITSQGEVIPRDLLEAGTQKNLPTRAYLTGAAAIVAGGVSAYFKIRADDSHDSFLQTGDPSRRDEYRRFDTLSGISLIVAQTGLVLFAYFLFSD
jgi:hypothetical protein